MRKKQPWMKIGAPVMAIGNGGHITAMQENTIDGTEYVYYIDVKLLGKKHSNPYHPDDVQQGEIVEVK